VDIQNVNDRDKAWFDETAAREGTANEVARRGASRKSLAARPFCELLQLTRGLWRGGDGLEYQTRLRIDG
jgi:hypothetical protein